MQNIINIITTAFCLLSFCLMCNVIYTFLFLVFCFLRLVTFLNVHWKLLSLRQSLSVCVCKAHLAIHSDSNSKYCNNMCFEQLFIKLFIGQYVNIKMFVSFHLKKQWIFLYSNLDWLDEKEMSGRMLWPDSISLSSLWL